MKIIDPLKLKILDLISSGNPMPLSDSRGNYGTDVDIEMLLLEVRDFVKTKEKQGFEFFLIDFTPFSRIPIREDFVTKLFDGLKCFSRPKPILLFFEAAPLSQLRSTIKNLGFNEPPIPICVFDKFGNFDRLLYDQSENKVLMRNLASWIQDRKTEAERAYGKKNPNTLLSIRKTSSNINLLELILECDCVEMPNLNSSTINNKYGRLFKKMPNGMLVSSYINLKKLGSSIDSMMAIAYEGLIFLADGFLPKNDNEFDFDAIVVPNHTSLFLCSILQTIVQKPIIALDRIGPVPSLRLRGAHQHSDYLQGKCVVIIEEVIATGNEVDRTLLYLAGIGIKQVKKVVAFFNLKVGQPYLIDEKDIISLCLPKDELKYVYRSE